MEKAFRSLSQVNLKAPMVNCLPGHQRMLIFQGDLRFRDSGKEHDVRAFLLTDMLLICKKTPKGPANYKLLRPKYMVDKLVSFPKQHSRANRDFLSLLYVVLDEVGSAYTAFTLSDPGKDGNGQQVTLKMWDQKVREAKKTYDMAVFYAKYPFRDLSEKDSSSELMKAASEEDTADRDAMERMATMLHGTMGTSSEYEYSNSMVTDTAAAGAETPGPARSRTPTIHSMRKQLARGSTGDSSRLSSLQQSLSASGDEPQPGPSKPAPKASTSTEAAITTTHVLPIKPSEDGVTSITVNIVSEPETEPTEEADSQTEVLQLSPTTQRCPTPQRSPSPHRAPSPQCSLAPTPQRPPMLQRSRTSQPPKLVMQQKVMPARSASAGHTLRVEPQGVQSLAHSLPDIDVEPPASTSQHAQPQSSSSLTASERLYQYHREQLQKRRLAATQPQYLTPDHRGISYPPTSPTRASLKRGLAFSHSLKYPPLCKMGHVQSQSQPQPEPSTSTTPTKVKEGPIEIQPIKPEKKSFIQTAKIKEKKSSKQVQPKELKDKDDEPNETHQHHIITEQEKDEIKKQVEKKELQHENDPKKPENNTVIDKNYGHEPEDMDKEKKKGQKKDKRQDKEKEKEGRDKREGKEPNDDKHGNDGDKGNDGNQNNTGDKNNEDDGNEDDGRKKRGNEKNEEKNTNQDDTEKERKKDKTKENPNDKSKGKGRGKKTTKITETKRESIQSEEEYNGMQKETINEDKIVHKGENLPVGEATHRKLQRTPMPDKFEIIPKAKIEEKLNEIGTTVKLEDTIEPADDFELENLAGVAAPELIIESSTTTSSTTERHCIG